MRKYEENQILVRSTADGGLEPSLFFEAEGKEKRPLLVGLHTWSFDRFNQVEKMLPCAKKHNFHLLLPEFRGSNTVANERCTEACGSNAAVTDIFDAISFVKENYAVDEDNIFLLGASGGGHMALMTAAKDPTLFRAVGSFVPITDLLLWTKQNSGYKNSVIACCVTEEEMEKRSPISYTDALSKANLKIFHGKFDNCVPYTHSVNIYLKIMEKDPTARVFLDIFDGGHEMSMEVAMSWLLSQMEKKKEQTVTG